MKSISDNPYGHKTVRQLLPSGVEIAYFEQGESCPTTMLFVHGLGNYSGVWSKMIHLLSPHFHCVAIDLPHHGDSSRKDSVTLASFAATLQEFIQVRGYKDLILVGHSMGGLIVLKALLSGFSSLKSFVLLAPAGFEIFTDKEKAWIKTIYTTGFLMKLNKSRVIEQFNENFSTEPDQVEFMINDLVALRESEDFHHYCDTLSACVKDMFDHPADLPLSTIKYPALVFFGLDDAVIPNPILHANQTVTQIAEAGTERLSNAQLYLLSNSGHMLQWESASEISKHLIEHFSVAEDE